MWYQASRHAQYQDFNSETVQFGLNLQHWNLPQFMCYFQKKIEVNAEFFWKTKTTTNKSKYLQEPEYSQIVWKH